MPKANKLTKKEQAWVAELNAILARVPTDRLRFFTIGDCDIHLYDKKHEKGVAACQDDLIIYLQEVDGLIDAEIRFPSEVQGVCG